MGSASVMSQMRSVVQTPLSTVCIFCRSVFRVAELSGGWTGPVMLRQDLFVGFEGVMVVVACGVVSILPSEPVLRGGHGGR